MRFSILNKIILFILCIFSLSYVVGTFAPSAHATTNCQVSAAQWTVSSVTPYYTSGKVGFTINGNFPSSQDCGRSTSNGGQPFSLALVGSNSYYRSVSGDIVNLSDNLITIGATQAYANGQYPLSLWTCTDTSDTNGNCVLSQSTTNFTVTINQSPTSGYTLQSFLWNDTNNDCKLNYGDFGWPNNNVTLVLTNTATHIVLQTIPYTPDGPPPSGTYAFHNVPNGSYQVTLQGVPTGYQVFDSPFDVTINNADYIDPNGFSALYLLPNSCTITPTTSPTPALTYSISPQQGAAGSQFTVNIANGTATTNTTVFWGGTTIATSIGPNSFTAIVPVTATAGNYSITVSDAVTGISQSFPFTVTPSTAFVLAPSAPYCTGTTSLIYLTWSDPAAPSGTTYQAHAVVKGTDWSSGTYQPGNSTILDLSNVGVPGDTANIYIENDFVTKSNTITVTIPTCTSPTSNPTATTTPSNTPTPTTSVTPTNSPVATFTFTNLFLHGIGSAGDNTNPLPTLSTTPTPPSALTRTVFVQFFKSESDVYPFDSAYNNLTYNASTGAFDGTINWPSAVSDNFVSGNYYLKIRVPGYLIRKIPNLQSITLGSNTLINNVSLIAGDIDSDNRLTVNDYSILLDCGYNDSPPLPMSYPQSTFNSPACQAHAQQGVDLSLVDINNDGIINHNDENVLERELNVQAGD